MESLVSIVIINYNNKSYLSRCMDSIISQSYNNIEVIFIDNSSKDGSFDYFSKNYPEPTFIKVKNEINNGYSGAANQGIKMSSGEFIMIINPDIILEPDFIEKIYNYAITNKDIAAVTGKLLKYDFQQDKKLNYIDSTGIVMTSNRIFIDRGQNDEDRGQYQEIQQVFGVCGAAPFYKREALDFISIDGEYFDEDFFAYKEDIDLSWRFNKAGYRCMYYPFALAYHGRGFGRKGGGIKSYINYRKSISKFIRGIAMRNNYLMLIKNDSIKSLTKDFIPISISILKALIFSLIFEQSNLRYLLQVFKLKKKMLYKRNELDNKIKLRESGNI